MKNRIFRAALFFLLLPFLKGQVQEQSLVVNIEVPVRVFQGGSFVSDLTIDDFEVLEDGVPQTIEAVYLIRKNTVERSEENKRFFPQTSRHFYLLFEIADYDAKIGEAVDVFVENALVPGDGLTVVTPVKSYKMKDNTFQMVPKAAVAAQLKSILRKDAYEGSSEYRATLSDIENVARALTASLGPGEEAGIMGSDAGSGSFAEYTELSLDEQLMMYASLLDKLENLRKVDQKRLLDFADHLKDEQGQKYVFMFYQREFIPQIEPRILDQFLQEFQERPDIIHNLVGIFDFYRRDISFDVEKVKQAFSDSSISIHFLFITKPPQDVYGVHFEEHSEDIYAAFREMARATGGYSESSMNPGYLAGRAVEAADNYYLLYYSPRRYHPDGKFKKITVRVKGRKVRVSHRAGYFAD